MAELRTRDLQIATYLVTIGRRLARVDRGRQHKVFVFEDVPESDVVAYYQDAKLVSPRKLFNSYRDLKNLLFEVA